MADANGIKSVSFPALSTGIFGYPLSEAADVAVKAFSDYLSGDTGLELVRMVIYDNAAYEAHLKALDQLEESGGMG